MTMPTPDKTWQFSINTTKPMLPGGYVYDFRTMMLEIKKALTGFTSNPWTVTGSSNKLTAGMDAVDRWTTTLQGANTSASIDTTGGNNVFRIRTVGSVFYQFTVTSGASTAKTQIVTDLNNVTTGFPSVPAIATLVASITGTNQLTISDSSGNAYIEIDTAANGSTLCATNQLGANLSGLKTIDSIVFDQSGVAHSWIVLKQAGIHSNFELLLDCATNSTSNVNYANIIVGQSGFTGGSITAKPTATTSTTLVTSGSNYWLNGLGNTAFGSVLHVMQSTDGQCTRIVCLYNGEPHLFALFDKPKNPVAGWVNPAIYFWAVNTAPTGSQMVANNWNTNASVSSIINGTVAAIYMTIEGWASVNILQSNQFQQRNQVTLEHVVLPIGLVSNTTGAKGRHGQIFDMWAGNILANSIGGYCDITYPDDSTRLYWQCDDFILPWSGLVSSPGPLPLVRW